MAAQKEHMNEKSKKIYKLEKKKGIVSDLWIFFLIVQMNA